MLTSMIEVSCFLFIIFYFVIFRTVIYVTRNIDKFLFARRNLIHLKEYYNNVYSSCN